MKESVILEKARELIADPKKWNRHTFAEDRNGNWEHYDSPKAVSFCARGAIKRVGDKNEWATDYVRDLFGMNTLGEVGGWNNESSHKEVMVGLDFAILAAKDEGR